MESTSETLPIIDILKFIKENQQLKEIINITNESEEKQNEFAELLLKIKKFLNKEIDSDDEKMKDNGLEGFEYERSTFSEFKKTNKPRTSIVYGPSGSGKTRFAMNFLNEAKEKYNIIYAFVGSKQSYEKYANYIDPRCIFYVDQDLLPIPEKKFEHISIKNHFKYHPIINWINLIAHEIIDMNKMARKKNPTKYEKNPKYKSLILFDDIYARLDKFNLKHDIFKRLFTIHRHINMDIILTAHSLNIIQEDILTSATHIIPFLTFASYCADEIDKLSRVTCMSNQTLKKLISSSNLNDNSNDSVLIIKHHLY